MITIKEALELLKVSRATFYKLVKAGKITPEPKSRAYAPGKGPRLVPRSQVEALIQ